MKAKGLNIEKIANDLRNKLYAKVKECDDLNYCTNLWAETECEGYVIEATANADVNYYTEYYYDKYDIACNSYNKIEDIDLWVTKLTICDDDGEEITDNNIIDEIIKLLEK